MGKSIIRDKAKLFAIRIIRLYQYLTSEKKNISFRNNYYVPAQVLVPIYRNKSLLFQMQII